MSLEEYATIFSLIGVIIIIGAWVIRFFQILNASNLIIIKIYQIVRILVLPIIPIIYYGVKIMIKLIKWESKGSLKRLSLFKRTT